MKTSELYFKNHIDNKVILVDFDNTICVDEWPNIGELIPGALDVIKKLQDNGHTLILYTQRSVEFPVCNPKLVEYMSKYPRLVSKTDSTYDFHSTNNVKKIERQYYVDIITPVIEYLTNLGLDFKYINCNEEWETITGDTSRKLFNNYIIDDHSICMKHNIIINSKGKECKTCDWKYIDKQCVELGLYNEFIFK